MKVRVMTVKQEQAALGEVVGYISSRNRLLFTVAMILDILTNSVENSLNYLGRVFSQERKKSFKEYVASIQSCKDKYEKCADASLWEEGKEAYDQYRMDANELIRAMMYYINAVKTEADYEEVMSYLKSKSDSVNEKLFTDEEINRFNFKKKR